MAGTYLHPKAGYIMNVGLGSRRGTVTVEEKQYLRELAKRVAEIAALPEQEERKKLWTAHNDRQPIPPLFICYPEDGWGDLLPVGSMKVADPFWASYEWYLRHLIYRREHIHDDFVTEPEIVCFVRHTVHNADWGLGKDEMTVRPDTTSYDWGSRRPLYSYDLLPRLKLPAVEIHREETDADFSALCDVFADILPVNQYLMCTAYGGGTYTCNQPGIAANLRGIEQIMWDMYDYPDELHELLRQITKGNIDFLLDIERQGLVRSNTGNYYTDAGGNGYTSDLPAQKFPAKLKDCWGYGVAQEYSEISPEMHDEFGIQYQKQVLELFGLNAYGCCEPYTNKFGIVRDIPRLRRLSVSPFCDPEKAAVLGRDILYSFKPNPALLVSDIPMEEVERYLEHVLTVSKGCCVEMFLKDIIHLSTPSLQHRFLELPSVIRRKIQEIYG